MHPNKIITEDLDRIVHHGGIDWSRFEGKTILISGANGFLPAYMIETLLHLKHTGKVRDLTILALVRNEGKARRKFAHHSTDTSLQFIVSDVANPIQIDRHIDFIVHAASQASPKYYGVDPVGTLKANTLGTYNMLELARIHGVESMLNFSSSEVYGSAMQTDGVSEDDYGYIDLKNVRACYSESKRMGEVMCVAYAHQYDVQVKSVRPFHTYGPGMLLDDGRVFADFVGNIVRNEDISLNSDGSAVRAFCYLADATVAFFKILLDGGKSESYNMANPAGKISIKELADLLVSLYPEKKLKATFKASQTPYLASQVLVNLPDISKIKTLGWNPSTSVEQGFKRTIDSYLID